jgi:glucose/arabinose dehydrogenase
MIYLVLPMILSALAFGNGWVQNLKLPKGFTVIKVIEVPGARQMAISPKGNLFVGTMDEGKVYSISPEGKVSTLFTGLNMPQGVLWHENELYVSEIQRVAKVIDLDKKPQLKTIREFPDKKWHGWKTLGKGPDGKLYVPVGAPCNVCDEKLPFMSLHRMDFDGKNFETIAQGIRNTVGFTWHPETKKLFFTEMGRDQMGDDTPPDEINVIQEKSPHFGFPYVHGKNIPDPKFHSLLPKSLKLTTPLHEIQAHSAPIGIAFFPKAKYPKEFHDCFLVAEHGSWNRSIKSGYQVMKGCLRNDQVESYEPFITGFKEGQKALARPVHFLFLEDGSFYLSEDEPGTILHIQFSPEKFL